MWQVEVSHKSEMAGLFNRGDTIINKHFTLLYFYSKSQLLGIHISFRMFQAINGKIGMLIMAHQF